MTVLCRKLLANHRRRGLTLMELVVVMFILIAVASIMVPIFPSMIERAHRSTGATNTSELTKAVQLYQAINGFYPDGYDLMTDGTTMINYMPSQPVASPMALPGDTAGTTTNYLGFQYPAGGYVSAAPLGANGLIALNGTGITTGYALLQDATKATAAYQGGLGWTPTLTRTRVTCPRPDSSR
jgi:type II secretory pathway pseudopilin PulG